MRVYDPSHADALVFAASGLQAQYRQQIGPIAEAGTTMPLKRGTHSFGAFSATRCFAFASYETKKILQNALICLTEYLLPLR